MARIYKKQEYTECWKLSTADIAGAPTWFRRLMKMGLVDLFEVGGGKCFWAVATDRGRVRLNSIPLLSAKRILAMRMPGPKVM